MEAVAPVSSVPGAPPARQGLVGLSCVCMYVCMYVGKYACMYVGMYICRHVGICVCSM